ncbi:copper-translocating P-type ATPase [Breznakia pachnodae]|nr:copper-translocating P-type ATPase [Breznakia pachnodae]
MEGHGGMMGHHHMMNFKKVFFVSLVLSIPILVLSPMMGVNLPFQFTFEGSEIVVLVLATILLIYGGRPFFSGAVSELKDRKPAMMTLVSMGLGVSYGYSVYAFIMNDIIKSDMHVMNYFWEFASLTLIMLFGHWMEMKSLMMSNSELDSIAKLLPSTAIVVNGDKQEEIALDQVKQGMRLLVRANDKVPVDGIVDEGSAVVNESIITGESKPIMKKKQDQVIGGSINGNTSFYMIASHNGQEGYLSQVLELVQTTQNQKTKIETKSNQVAGWLFYIALTVGILAFIIWGVTGKDWNVAMERMISVFIIACPHALGLAIPLVIARATGIAANQGVLIKNKNVWESVENLEYLAMDKTGTLTQGSFEVTNLLSLNKEYTEKEVFEYFVTLEKHSSHPIALSILKAAESKKIEGYPTDDVELVQGVGMSGNVNGKDIKIVNEDYLISNNISYDKELYDTYSKEGNTISYLVIDNVAVGMVTLADQLRPEAMDLIKNLHDMNIEPIMMSGDNADAVKTIAEYLGIKKYYAQLLPQDKADKVKELKKDHPIMMVGDGVNDAPSLANASVSMAIGNGTDVAKDSADMLLVKNDLSKITMFLHLAKKTHRKMKENLWWGAGYNILAIPLAAGVFAPIGIVLSPAIGAILMSLSTIIVAINAMRLHL